MKEHAAQMVDKAVNAHDAGNAAAEAAALPAWMPGWTQSAEIWIAVSFFICIALVLRYLLPMITKGLDARADKIRDQLEQAKRLREEAEALLASYQQQQQATLKEAEAILANAQKDAADLRAKAVDDLKQSLDRRAQQAQEKIARAEVDAIAQIRRTMIDNATASARTMIANELQGSHEDDAVTRAIAAIEQQIH